MLRSYVPQSPAGDPLLPHVSGAETLRGRKEGKINHGLLLYPVPAHEMLNIELEFELAQDAQFELYDLTGKMIASTKLQKLSRTGQLSTAKLSPGIYAYRLVGGANRFYGTVNIQH